MIRLNSMYIWYIDFSTIFKSMSIKNTHGGLTRKTSTFYQIKLNRPRSIQFTQNFSQFSYEDQTVMMAPASGFYSNGVLGKKQARLAYVLKKDSLINAIKCLEEALKVYPGRD